MTQRLDKEISKKLNISRSQAKALIKSKAVFINGACAENADLKISGTDEISVNGKSINKNQFVYIMLNKPEGVISASSSNEEKTVIDLLPQEMRRKGLFPAGRLDKNTTGFALITDDGEFSHKILSPKNHISKTYTAVLDKPFTHEVKEDFEKGMLLNGSALLPAKLCELDGDFTRAEIIISQGIYHQIKRMFKKHGITVLKLKRTKIGALCLDKSLKERECRYITSDELNLINS